MSATDTMLWPERVGVRPEAGYSGALPECIGIAA